MSLIYPLPQLKLNLPYEQIAELLGVSEGTVGATLTQARAALEDLLAEEVAREQR